MCVCVCVCMIAYRFYFPHVHVHVCVPECVTCVASVSCPLLLNMVVQGCMNQSGHGPTIVSAKVGVAYS